MTEKKRLPPWEQARVVFRMQEQKRKSKFLEDDIKQRRARTKRIGPNTIDQLEENRKRLAEMRKRLKAKD